LTDGMAGNSDFASRLLEWFTVHGRHDLPWQRRDDAYSVWVSEIMLQQTQVATVIPYFERFMSRFPDVAALAAAPLDDVLAHWAGLGYYARARHLHRTAGIVCAQHDGRLPDTIESLTALPGIGRSTAGAILSIAYKVRAPILDGNVKRVLTRRAGIEEWSGSAAVTKRLWALAEALTPHERVAQYTQAIMDLGATLCMRSRPLCMYCPVAVDCRARLDGTIERIPAPKPRAARPRRSVRMIVLQDGCGRVLLERRPAAGVWAGLFSLPEIPGDAAIDEWSRDYAGVEISTKRQMDVISHSFTHFDLDIEPLHARVSAQAGVMDRDDRVWYKPGSSKPPGMPAPVSKLLATLD
jgi:A/G-specific adenine glycosylase